MMVAPMTTRIEVVDVGPRDGLQSQPQILDVATRIEFIRRLMDAGVRRLEAVSFVNPKRVPQMAGAEQVLEGLPPRDDVSCIALVLNTRGFDRALAAGVREVNCVVVATDTFSERNQGMSTQAMLEAIASIAARARAAGVRCGATIAAAFGCPYEGEVRVGRIVDIAARLAAMRVDEVALADTIGVAAPSDVTERVTAVRAAIGALPLRAHFHNTRNTGIANAYAALEAGVRILDASCGGIGGCPFAPAATGNIATEDLLYMLHRMGCETGISIEGVVQTARWLEEVLGAPVPAAIGKAGVFPPVITVS
jgi:hydroxymethylglutaryl-CoA lyase